MNDIELEAELNDLRMSEGARPLFNAVKRHITENVDPITEEFFRLGHNRADRWSWAPGQLELLETAKTKAKAAGLWNFFLPNVETGQGLSNLDYAYIAVELGKSPLAYFQDLRVEHARRLVRSGVDIDAIAAEVGYVDGATLRTLLRRRLGRGVRELRTEVR